MAVEMQSGASTTMAGAATGTPVEDMWIGPLGLLHRMQERGEWERTPDLGVDAHVSLHGTVTTSRARHASRTTTLSWDRLDPSDADALEEIALVSARQDPTIAVIDPDAAAGNLLTAEQSRGRPGPGSAPDALAPMYSITGGGDMAVGLIRSIRYACTRDAVPETRLTWLHPYYGRFGWPVMPGWPIYLAAALGNGTIINDASVGLTFYDHNGAPVSSAAGDVGDGHCEADTPSGAVTVSPHATVSADAPGLRLLGEARMSYAPHDEDIRPLGNGCPVYTVTALTDTPALPYRSTSLTLQEVRTHAYR